MFNVVLFDDELRMDQLLVDDVETVDDVIEDVVGHLKEWAERFKMNLRSFAVVIRDVDHGIVATMIRGAGYDRVETLRVHDHPNEEKPVHDVP